MFSSLVTAVITGGTFTHHTVIKSQILPSDSYERLLEATAPNAFHNAGERRDPPKCHHNTRVAILEKILQWILACDSQSKDKLLMWIYGPAGAGKSAIAQSISDICYDDQLLLASFFFSRFDNSRNHVRSLIPTIAYQITEYFPGETRKLIIDQIDRDPLIFTRSLQTQITSLIVNPLKPLIKSKYFDDPQKCRRVVIIDGLDECIDRERQLEILNAVQQTLVKQDVPLIFLIASRPEHDLMGAFQSEPLHGFSAMLPLDDGYQSHRDIELFLRDNFTELKTNHPSRSCIPLHWPDEDDIQQLVLKSSGQFIYAATVMKYIKSTRHRPPDRLEIILGLRPSNQDMPFSELDALYTHILSSLEDPKPVLQILAFHILSMTRYVDHVGHMEKILSINRGDTETILCEVGSMLKVVEQPVTQDRTLHIFHASLEDFLLDKSRSEVFWVDAPSRHAEFVRLYIQYFQNVSTSGNTLYPIAGIFDLGAHIKKALPTATLRDDVVFFSKAVLSMTARTLKSESELQPHYPTNDLLDFLEAIKKSQFEDAHELYLSLQLELGVVVEEWTDERLLRTHSSKFSSPASDLSCPSYDPIFVSSDWHDPTRPSFSEYDSKDSPDPMEADWIIFSWVDIYVSGEDVL